MLDHIKHEISAFHCTLMQSLICVSLLWELSQLEHHGPRTFTSMAYLFNHVIPFYQITEFTAVFTSTH